MKELIYRRGSAGYEIDRCAEGLSAASRVNGPLNANKGLNDKDRETFCYRQFRLEDGAIVLSAGYADPYSAADRNTLLCHLLYADGPEAGALLDSYPANSGYFSRFREAFARDDQFHAAPGEMEIPLQTYLDAPGGLPVAAQTLRERFPEPEALAAAFEALLDAASDHPRAVVLFGPDEPTQQLAETGRSVIEALLAPLPNVLIRHLGYLSPGLTDSDNALFGVRYSRRRTISSALRGYAYVIDLTTGELRQPNGANHAAAEYARELAQLMLRGDELSLSRVRQMKKMLDDEGLYHEKDVPAQLAMRYRFYSGPDRLAAADRETLLDWRHRVILDAEKTPGALDRSKFWAVVERWAAESALPGLYADPRAWKDAAKRIDELYRDGQRLFLLGRPEAERYFRAFSARLGAAPMLDAASEDKVRRQLIDCVLKELQRSKDNRFAERILYWNAIERWMRQTWNAGELFQDNAACEAVRRLYDLDPRHGEAYVDAFAEACARSGKPLLSVTGSAFGRTAFDRLAERRPETVEERMSQELGGKNLFALPGSADGPSRPGEAPALDGAVVGGFVRYRELVKRNERLLNSFEAIVDERLSTALRRAQSADLPRLFAELKAAEQENHIVGVCRTLIPRRDAREAIENCIAALTRSEGVYPWFPQHPALARDVAELLDRRTGTDWSGRLKVLEKAHGLDLAALEDDDFDALMERGFGGDDPALDDAVRRILWQNVERSFDGKRRDSRRLLMALALCGGAGRFSPAVVLKGFETLGVPREKALAACKKLRRADAVRGAEYVAQQVYAFGAEREKVEWAEYPGYASPRRRSRGMFAGVPMPAAIAVAAASCAGLAASVVGFLVNVGLM